MVRKKLFNPLAYMLPFLLLLSCSKDKDEKPVDKDVTVQDLSSFEQAFSNSLDYKSDKTIKLIGYKEIQIPKEKFEDFKAFYQEKKEKLKNYYYHKETATFRAYFPVEGALVAHKNKTVEASELGELDLTANEINSQALFVIGRKQTDKITGVEGNVIKDGIIYLAEKNKSVRRYGNLYVFDFGIKRLMHHHGDSQIAKAYGKVSCMNNHGGPNCSDAFGIYKGRCPFNANVCMDYNGWFTNCVNGKLSNFPGSDCDYALGSGHCWNEVM